MLHVVTSTGIGMRRKDPPSIGVPSAFWTSEAAHEENEPRLAGMPLN